MTQTRSAQHTSSLPARLNRRLKPLFILCLVISITLHIMTIIGVITTNKSPGSGTVVNIIDIKDMGIPSGHTISAMNPPVQPIKQQEPAQLPPDKPANDAINNDNMDSTKKAAADIMETPLGLGMAKGYFSSLAEGRTLRDDIRGYYFDVLEKINQKWWEKAGELTEVAQQDGIIEIVIGRDGTLFNVRLIRSTGSRVVDRTIIDAITESAPFPPLPASLEQGIFQAPLKISKPSHLFGVRNTR